MSEESTLPKLSTSSIVLLDIDLLEPNEGQLEGLPANPRDIISHKYELLKQNIVQYPQFLKYNALKVYPLDNGHYIVIGGNMRCRALKELGFTEAPCTVVEPTTSIEELKAYVILDNSNFGRWEWSMVANEWDSAQMTSWGVDLPVMETDVDIDEFFEAVDELNQEEKPDKIVISLPAEYKGQKKEIISIVDDILKENGYNGYSLK